VPALNLPPSERSKWIYVVIFVACGLGAVSKAPHSVGLTFPLLLVFLWALWLKVMLEFAWHLPIRVLNLVHVGAPQRPIRVRTVLGISAVVVLVSSLVIGGVLV
jgi:hypothetical protein